jgi:hypothetical protein
MRLHLIRPDYRAVAKAILDSGRDQRLDNVDLELVDEIVEQAGERGIKLETWYYTSAGEVVSADIDRLGRMRGEYGWDVRGYPEDNVVRLARELANLQEAAAASRSAKVHPDIAILQGASPQHTTILTLKKYGVPYTVKNKGLHYIVRFKSGAVVNYWPTTDKWVDQKTDKGGIGIAEMLSRYLPDKRS